VEKKGEYLRLRFLILIIQNANDTRLHSDLANDSKEDIIGRRCITTFYILLTVHLDITSGR